MCKGQAILIHQAAIGDFLICLRVLDLWTDRDQCYRWTYLGKPAVGRLARSWGVIDTVYDFEVGPWHRLFGPASDFTVELKRFFSRFSLVVNVLAGPESAVSRNIATLACGQVYHVDPRPGPGFVGHCWQYLARQVRPAGELPLPTSAYRPSNASLAAGRRIITEAGIDPQRLVLIHPGASSEAKRWPTDNFIALAQAIRSASLAVGFVIGPVELEQFTSDRIDRLGRLGHVWCRVGLDELAAMLHLTRGYVGSDNGISHLAGAVGARTVVVFVNSDADTWRPLGPDVHVVESNRSVAGPAEIATLVDLLNT